MNQPAYSEARLFVIGFRQWKAYNLRPLLEALFRKVVFVSTPSALQSYQLNDHDYLAIWGMGKRNLLSELSAAYPQQKLLHIEDGFVRSVGLGSDLIRPCSLVLDSSGIYFDPTKPSGLENILNHHQFNKQEMERAKQVQKFIVEHRITKYNIERQATPAWRTQAAAKAVILVPGQVEDDASIRYGCTAVNNNLALLQAAREAHPDGFIVYKVHPDVLARNRRGKIDWEQVRHYADVIETEISVDNCIHACDVVHTMTSLTGFDALLRGKTVVTYGQPFYAGWGLTNDQGKSFPPERRVRKLTLDELTAAALLLYPMYFDWQSRQFTTCETVLKMLLEQKKNIPHQHFWLRQCRKASVLLKAMVSESLKKLH